MKRKMLRKITAVVLVSSMLLSYEVNAAYNGKKNKNNHEPIMQEQESAIIKEDYNVSSQEGETTSQNNDDVSQSQDCEWNLIWNDEFNGNKLDTSKWSYQIGNGYNGWGNNEQQYYTKENVTVSNGSLKITAKEENINGYKYTSSRIRTVTDDGTKLFTAKYGKFEARIKLPSGQGLWPAFWMMPADNKYGMWPLSGEIDIMEARGRVLDIINGTIHFGESRPFNKSLGSSYKIPEGSDITGYHVYGIEWNENTIIWYVDGIEYYRTSNWYTTGINGTADYPAPFDQEFYLILNMAIGGNYDGNITPNSKDLPGTMEVDYVRVYQKNSGYNDSNIVMPEGTRDDATAKDTPIFENGNLLYDINFDTINKTAVYDSGLNYLSHYWFFINSQYFGGTATLSKTAYEDNIYATVHIKEPGTLSYAIQLKQLLPLAKGYVYKVSFNAKSLDADRTIKVKPVGGAARGYINYNDSYVASLTSTVKSYEFTFMMKDETDLAAMLEFNLGSTMGDVMIGKVVVTLVNTYNLLDNTKDTQPSKEINLGSTSDNPISKIPTEENSTVGNSTGDKNMQDESFTNMEGKTDETKQEETTEQESVKNIIKSAISNGDFSQGISVWNVYGTYYALEEKEGNVYGKIYTKPKQNPWDRMWLQDGVFLTKGEKYTLTFKAKSSAENQKFAVTLEDMSYNKTMHEEFIVGTQWQTLSYTFYADTESELTLKYLLGMVTTDCKLYLDDVKITWS